MGIGLSSALGLGIKRIGSENLRYRYILRDDFTTGRAAGEVDGTPAEPGSGTRYCQEASATPMITDGWLALGANETADGTPGIWLTSDGTNGVVTLGQGRLVVAKIKGDGNPIWCGAGWDVDKGSHVSNMGLFIEASVPLWQTGNPAVFQAVNNDEEIYIAITVSGSAGSCLHFIKSTTTFPEWTLLWSSNASAYTDLWPVVNKENANYINTSYVKFLRCPETLWFPMATVVDLFTTTFGISTGDSLGGGAGITWTTRVGTWGITSSRAYASAVTGSTAIATVPAQTANQYISAKFFRSTGSIGLIARYTDANNYIKVVHDGTNFVATEVIDGTPNTLFTTETAYSAGAFMVVWVNGANLRVYYDSKLVNTATTSLLTGTETGLFSSAASTGNSLDNFLVRPVVGSDYALLDRFIE
jgi:hypothetical protein